MCQNRWNSIMVTLLMVMCVCALSCSDVNDEESKDRIRFAEFIFFPTAPYVDKSYIEDVPADEVATLEIDFETEISAIQDVYRTFINAYVEKDMSTISELFDRSKGMEYGTSTANVFEWNNIKVYIESNWHGPFGVECRSESDWELTDFYIRPKNVIESYADASAKGPMFYYEPGLLLCYDEIGTFYFTKRFGEWRIHQIDGSKYFSDTKYKAP